MASDQYVPNIRYSQEDWDEISDNPELTDEDMAQSRLLAEVMPEIVAAARRYRGAQRAPVKALVSLRVDRDVLEAWRATGSGWQRRINDVLRKAMEL